MIKAACSLYKTVQHVLSGAVITVDPEHAAVQPGDKLPDILVLQLGLGQALSKAQHRLKVIDEGDYAGAAMHEGCQL